MMVIQIIDLVVLSSGPGIAIDEFAQPGSQRPTKPFSGAANVAGLLHSGL